MRLFVPDDLPMINGWLAARGQKETEMGLLPGFGMIEPDVAVGFSMEMDSKIAIIHQFISSPAVTSERRAAALLNLGFAMVEHARMMGMKRIIFQSVHPGILKWADDNGFVTIEPQLRMLAV